MAQRLKCLPAMQETWVRSMGREDPLEKEMVTHSSILAWRSPWTERLQSTGSQSRTRPSDFTSLNPITGLSRWLRGYRIYLQCQRLKFDPWVGKIPWRRARKSSPVFLPGESHGQRSLAGQQSIGSQGVGHDN